MLSNSRTPLLRTRDPFGSFQRIRGSGLPLALQVSCVLEDSFTVRFGVENWIAGASEQKKNDTVVLKCGDILGTEASIPCVEVGLSLLIINLPRNLLQPPSRFESQGVLN